MLGFVNYFGKIGGFDAIAELLEWKSADLKHRLPILIMKCALPVVEAFSKILSTNFKQDYVTKLKTIIFDRLQNLTQNDLKDSQIKNLFTVVK